MRRTSLSMASFLGTVLAVACSGTQGTSRPGGTGGGMSSGGSRETSTAASTVGGSGGGGAAGGTGGQTLSAGGATATGGQSDLGGRTSSPGGATGGGGEGGTGGTTSTGGVATGGVATGGSRATGGATTTGGQSGLGGRTSSPGGATGSGGEGGTGGRTSTGGSRATAGATGTGGAGGAGGTTSAQVCPFTNEVMGWATQSGTTTGGGNATPTVVSSLSALNDAAKGTNAAVIQISGTISGSVSIGSNKTLIGDCGSKATIKGHIQMSGSKNVILRNLIIVGNNCSDSPSDCSAGEDAITVVSSANHLWFDHCDISDGSDGNLDMTHAADFITISWTKFHYSGRRSGDHQFCNLIGHSDDNASEDNGHLNVTFDHVWWADNVAQRMPRVRFGKVHVVNSLYTASGNDSGVGVGVDCNIRVENSVFVGINSAFYFNNSNSASIAESVGNTFTGSSGTSGRGTSFKPPYPYALENLSTVQASVGAGAGTK